MANYRLRYTKQDELRFISHLDLVRGFVRILRRAELPVAYSEGFNPHPKLGFGPALPLGVESLAEYLDMELTKQIPPETIKTRLNNALPQGIRVLEVVEAVRSIKPLTAVINCAVYQYEGLTIPGSELEQVKAEVCSLWNQEVLEVTRRAKSGGEKKLNVRGFLKKYQWLEQQGEKPVLVIETVVGNNGTIRPDEFLRFFTIPLSLPRIIRTGLWVDEGDIRISPIELCQ